MGGALVGVTAPVAGGSRGACAACRSLSNRRFTLPAPRAPMARSPNSTNPWQGDSELDGTGVETSVNGKFKLTLHKADALPKIVQARLRGGWPAGCVRHLLPRELGAAPRRCHAQHNCCLPRRGVDGVVARQLQVLVVGSPSLYLSPPPPAEPHLPPDRGGRRLHRAGLHLRGAPAWSRGPLPGGGRRSARSPPRCRRRLPAVPPKSSVVLDGNHWPRPVPSFPRPTAGLLERAGGPPVCHLLQVVHRPRHDRGL